MLIEVIFYDSVGVTVVVLVELTVVILVELVDVVLVEVELLWAGRETAHGYEATLLDPSVILTP